MSTTEQDHKSKFAQIAGRQSGTAKNDPAFDAYLSGVDEIVLLLNSEGIPVKASRSAMAGVGNLDRLMLQPFDKRIVDAGHRQEFQAWLSKQYEALRKASSSAQTFDQSYTSSTRINTGTQSEPKPVRMDVHAFCRILSGQTVCFVTLRNSESRLEREEELTRWAFTDPLTELNNRRGFQLTLEQRLGCPIVLAIIDIDHFKAINDQYGHLAGDQTIQRVASVLAEELDGCEVARLGGDEFGVVGELNHRQTAWWKNRFDCLLSKMNKLGNKELPAATISGGMVVDPGGKMTARELLTAADKALYQSKSSGRNRMTVANGDP